MLQFWKKTGREDMWERFSTFSKNDKGGYYNNAKTKVLLKKHLKGLTPTARWIDIGLTDAKKGLYVHNTQA